MHVLKTTIVSSMCLEIRHANCPKPTCFGTDCQSRNILNLHSTYWPADAAFVAGEPFESTSRCRRDYIDILKYIVLLKAKPGALRTVLDSAMMRNSTACRTFFSDH